MSCVRGCVQPRRHLLTCESDTCRGCLPEPATNGHLCYGCTTTIRQTLRALPNLIAYTASRADGRLSPGRQSTDISRHTINPSPASPSPAWDVADDALWWIWKTATAAADAAKLRGPFRYRADGIPAPYNPVQLAEWAVLNLTWYATVVPVEMYDEVTALKRDIERVSGQDTLVNRLPGVDCPNCDRRGMLARPDGSDHVTCGFCHQVWAEEEYPWLAHIAHTATG